MIEIRNDDILQSTMFSRTQRKVLETKSLFDYFLEIDKYFEKYNYPCILAVISEGIDKCPEWVEHIKKNISRYKIELHGKYHRYYGESSANELENELREAKEKIENTFNVKVSKWYVPFGRKGRHQNGEEVCSILGITQEIPLDKVDAEIWLERYKKTGASPFNHLNFHSWALGQNSYVEKILDILNEKL